MTARRQSVEASLGNRLRAPLHHLAAIEIPAEELMCLELLKKVVNVERGRPVIETDDDSKRHEVRCQGVHEASAERVLRERPAQSVNDRVERLLRLPDLLDAERIDLGIVGRDLLPFEIRLR